MAEFTLHCFSESGNAYKAALMLQLCGADWDAAPGRLLHRRNRRRNSAR
jgi:hypothetical protein